MKFRFAMLGVFLLAASISAQAHDATAVLARAKAVSGGTQWDDVRMLGLEGEKSAGGLTGAWQTTQDLGRGRYVESARLGAFDQAEGYDGRLPWRRDVGGEVALLDGAIPLRRMRSLAWLTTRGYWYAERATARYSATQQRSFGGRRYDVVGVTPQGGDAVELWFDTESGLLARIVLAASGGSIVSSLQDYREVDGLRLPHRIAIGTIDGAGREDPRQRSELQVQRYAVNRVAADADFAPPPMPTDARVDNATGVTRIPFDLVNNHMYVDATIDGKPARFLVDTGAVNLLTPAAAKRLGLSDAGRFSVSGAGENNAEFGYARARNLRVGDAVLSDPVFYVLDLGEQPNSTGVPYDGYIGYEMFRRFGTTFDYAARVLSLSEPTRYQPPAGATALGFEQDDYAPILAGALDGIPLRLWVDTGSRGSLSLFSPFVRAHGLIRKYRAAGETVVGWGIGGPARARPARLGTLAIGEIKVEGLAGDLSSASKGAESSPDLGAILGGGTLRRFTVGLDYAAKRMYLAPNAASGKPSAFDRSGLWLQADGDALRVGDVAADSAAARARLRENDRIVSIGGEAASVRGLGEWRARLRELPVGTRLVVGFRRDGKAGEAELVLADRIPSRWRGD